MSPTEDGRTGLDSARIFWCAVREVFLFLLEDGDADQFTSLVLSTLYEGYCVRVLTGPQEGHNETARSRQYISAVTDDNLAGGSG